MKKRLCTLCLILLAVGTTFAGCKKKTSDEPASEKKVTQTVATEEPQLADNHEGQAQSILTGEWIDESLASKRPIALMIENTEATLPQYNISKADLIYECPVEGGITRLMGLYQDYSGMDRIGNVRSCRLYYVYFAKEFDAIYVHAGESKYAVDVLDSDFIDNIDGIKAVGNTCFYRTNDRKAPHNLYISSDGISQAITELGYRTDLNADYKGHYQFAKDENPVTLTDSSDAAVVALAYVNPKPWFEYHEDDGLYYRYEFGNPQKDAVTDEQLAVRNIILQECNSHIMDTGNGTLDVDYMSGGKGKYISNEKAVDITWKKDSDTSPTRYYDASGNEITLNQGKTWVCIIPSDTAENNIVYGSKDEFEANK